MSDNKTEDMQVEHAVSHGHETTDISHDEHDSYKISIRTYVVLITMAFTWGTCTMGNIGPSTTYSYAVAELGGASISSWIPNAALLPIIGLQPIWGSLGDRFGKKWFIVSGGVAGLTGNIIAGTAKTTEIVVLGQAINGIGSSLFLLVIPSAMEIVPAKQRSFVQGLLGSINGTMAIVVLIVSGSFAQMSSSGWRWVFYLNAIFFGTLGLLIWVFYNPPPTKLRRENTAKEIIQSVDVIGTTLFLCGIIGLVMALAWGGNVYAWDNPRVVALLGVGCALLAGFSLYEYFGRKDGLLDHRFFEDRNYPLVLSVAFVDGMLLYGVNAFLPQQIVGLFTHKPIMVSVYLLPLNLGVITGVMSSAYVLGVLKHYRLLLVVSLLLISLFCGLLALVTASKLAMLLIFTGLIGFGVGVTTLLPAVILTYAVPSHLIGTAGTLLASMRAVGGTIGITIFAAIQGNYLAVHQIKSISEAALDAGLPQKSLEAFIPAIMADAASAATIDGVTESVIQAAQAAILSVTAGSYKYVWVANAAIGVASTVLTCFLKPVVHKMTSYVEAPLEKGELRSKVEASAIVSNDH